MNVEIQELVENNAKKETSKRTKKSLKGRTVGKRVILALLKLIYKKVIALVALQIAKLVVMNNKKGYRSVFGE